MRRGGSGLRSLAGAAILGVLLWRLGAGPFVEALGRIDGWSLAVAAGLAALTTVCGAWRWFLVARGLGVDLTLRSAVAECYRSQFLNVTLPGGVIGDVHRGVRHGRDSGDLSRGLRSVLWERTAGQVVLGCITLGAVLVLPSPLRVEPTTALVALVVVLLAGAAMRRLGTPPDVGPLGRPSRLVRTALADVRAGLLGRHTWPGVVTASIVVVAGHVATFAVAARAAGVTAPATQIVPLALLVLVAMAVPLNLAGWGPREGAAAWLFSAAGLGAASGVGTAVVHGVMVLVASLPGAVLLVVARRAHPSPVAPPTARLPHPVGGATRG